ncbi:50S ribosomal protein L17 [Candidatus Microgenomates bacterium]|nr:50S ribosomal protein L17 [Candidatus Microgenomates bacterium]
MNHKVFGRKLHRNKKGRAQLFKVLVHNFVVHGRLTTTEAKAKAVRPFLEKLMTKAKKGETQRPLLLKETSGDRGVVNGLFKIAEVFANVPGGYTKLIKIPTRKGDNGRQLLMIWSKQTSDVGAKTTVPAPSVTQSLPKTGKTKKVKEKIMT